MPRYDRFTPHAIQTEWELAFAIILLIAIFGWVGQMDYADARMHECDELSTAAAEGIWNPQTDQCVMVARKQKR